MAYLRDNYTYSDENRYRRAMEDDGDMMIDHAHSFSGPYEHDYRTRRRPPRSSRRQRCSEYITWPQPVNVDYIVPDRRPRRHRDHTSRSYAADYIDHPHEREDDHISPAPYNGSSSTSAITYIKTDGDMHQNHTYGFSQPIHPEAPPHSRHASMPSFSTPCIERATHNSKKNDTFETHRPHNSSKQKKLKTRRRSPPRNIRSTSPDSYPSDYQSFSSPSHTTSRAPKPEYGSDFEPLLSPPRALMRLDRHAYPSDTKGICRSFSVSSSGSSSASISTSDQSGGFQFSEPQRTVYSSRRQRGYGDIEFKSSRSLGEEESEESESESEEETRFGSDVEFEVRKGSGGRRDRDSRRSSLERSDYVADSIDESESGSDVSDSSSEDEEVDSEDNSSCEYVMR